MKLVIGFSALLLCLVTLSSTVLFWSSMPADHFGKVLAGITATALEACKYSFFPAGIYYLKKRHPGGFALLFMGVVLVCISVAAITGFLENAYSQHVRNNQQSSLEYQTKTQQLNSIQQQIDTLNNLVAADAASSYRARAYENSKQIKTLEAQRDSALADLQSYRESPQGNAQSLFAVLAIPLEASAEAVRQGAFIALAVIVDICAIAALLALGGMRQKKPETPAGNAAETRKSKVQKQTPKVAPNVTTLPLSSAEQKIAADIIAGVYGQPPTVRGIIAGAKVSHSVVSKIMADLLSKNYVTREGKQYFLTQEIIG